MNDVNDFNAFRSSGRRVHRGVQPRVRIPPSVAGHSAEAEHHRRAPHPGQHSNFQGV